MNPGSSKRQGETGTIFSVTWLPPFACHPCEPRESFKRGKGPSALPARLGMSSEAAFLLQADTAVRLYGTVGRLLLARLAYQVGPWPVAGVSWVAWAQGLMPHELSASQAGTT